MKLYFHTQGEGVPLVILHGLLGSSDNWRAVSKRLSATCKVYAVDLRNHGKSPHNPTMTFADMVEDLRELFDGEEIPAAHLLGHSMGGKVAMLFATTYSEKTGKLIVVDIAPKAYPPSQDPILAALNKLDLRTFKSFAEIDSALAPGIVETPMRQFLMKNIARVAGNGFAWRINLPAITNSYNELTREIVAPGRYEKPACFMRGEGSDYIQDGDISAIQNIFPHAELVTIAGAGHWVHAEAPEEFLRAVSGFLADK
jgi:pimeloyl-ACP methyl ester carboxylesterase